MRITIDIDTTTLTPEDRAILSALSGGGHGWTEERATPTPTEQAVREAIDEEFSDPWEGASPLPEPAPEPEKPKRKRRTKAEMEAARAAEAEKTEDPDVDTDVGRQARDEDDEPEAAPADLPAPEEAQAADEEPSTVIERFRAEAVERASALVAQGQRQKVKEALQAVGAPKVSQLPDDKLAEFLGHLKD